MNILDMTNKKMKKWLKIACKEPEYVIRLLKNKLRKKLLFDYRFLKGYSFAPYALSIVPTYRCNLRCKMCNQYEGDYKKGASQLTVGEDELSLEQWKSVIDDVERWKPHINLFGGEPLLYKETLELLMYIKSKGLSCSIATNGVLLERYAERLVQISIEAVNISLDGPEEVNNFIRGTSDAFQRTVKGIEVLQAFKKEAGLARPRIHVNCVISSWNVDRLHEIVDLAETLNLDALNFQHLMFSSEALNQANGQDFHNTFGYDPNLLDYFPVLSTETVNIEQLASFISSARQNSSVPIRFLPNITLNDLSGYYHNLQHQFPNTMCIAPWIRATITPKGDVTPCIGYRIGNVKTHRFTEIWNSPSYKVFRAELQKRKLFPGCARCCHRRFYL